MNFEFLTIKNPLIRVMTQILLIGPLCMFSNERERERERGERKEIQQKEKEKEIVKPFSLA